MPPGIHLAIHSGNTDMVNFLLENNDEMYEAKDNEGWSTLHMAAEIGNLDLCQRLSQKIDPNYKCQNKTALELAFLNDKWECVNFLKNITEHGDLTKPVEKP